MEDRGDGVTNNTQKNKLKQKKKKKRRKLIKKEQENSATREIWGFPNKIEGKKGEEEEIGEERIGEWSSVHGEFFLHENHQSICVVLLWRHGIFHFFSHRAQRYQFSTNHDGPVISLPMVFLGHDARVHLIETWP